MFLLAKAPGYYFYSPQSSSVIKSKMAAITIRTWTSFRPPKIRLDCRLVPGQHYIMSGHLSGADWKEILRSAHHCTVGWKRAISCSHCLTDAWWRKGLLRLEKVSAPVSENFIVKPSRVALLMVIILLLFSSQINLTRGWGGGGGGGWGYSGIGEPLTVWNPDSI